MANIIDYIVSTQELTFTELPLNDADIVCLNELGYLPLGESHQYQENVLLSDLGEWYHQHKATLEVTFMVTRERIALFEAMLSSVRFQQLTISHYVNDINSEFEKQFAAMVFHLPEINHWQLVFRGTDDTLIGWKEDFKLTYMSEIPAQRAAIRYLHGFLDMAEHPIYVTGHSKGGNLAVYAAGHQTLENQAKITAVYMLDGPGFHDTFLARRGYQEIREKITVINPKESIVGVMLTSDLQPMIVEAQEVGISQHAVTTWQVTSQGQFELAEQTELSRNLEKTFDQWVSELSKTELKLLVDTFFDQFIDRDIRSLDDLTNPKNAKKLVILLGAFNQLPSAKKALFQKSVKLLLGMMMSNASREWSVEEWWKSLMKKTE